MKSQFCQAVDSRSKCTLCYAIVAPSGGWNYSKVCAAPGCGLPRSILFGKAAEDLGRQVYEDQSYAPPKHPPKSRQALSNGLLI